SEAKWWWSALIATRVGEYVVTGIRGAGGMSVVYEGVQSEIGKRVAIKGLYHHYASDAEFIGRLVDEARAVNAIKHPGIVDVFSTGTLPDGRRYIAMELLEGKSLEQLMAERKQMPAAEVLELVDELLDPIEAAHQAGVIHRDLKPS